MALAPNVLARIAAIQSDDVHGASWLSRQALGTVALCAEETPASEADALLAAVRACLAALAGSRPEMLPIRHWIERLEQAIKVVAQVTRDPSSLRAAPKSGGVIT